MARLPRLTVAGYPHHIIQRGNNRQAIFADAGDFEFFLSLLVEHAERLGVAIHAYVLMSNHFHLIAAPPTAEALPQLMQSVGRSYVRHFNRRQKRTGTLWEGRYKSTIIQAERYLLACMAYIDLNPVRAGLVDEPGDYAWSSYRHFAVGRTDRVITPHPLYWELGNTPFAREVAYAELVRSGISESETRALTSATLGGWVLGDAHYVAELQEHTRRRVARAPRGRPRAVSLAQRE